MNIRLRPSPSLRRSDTDGYYFCIKKPTVHIHVQSHPQTERSLLQLRCTTQTFEIHKLPPSNRTLQCTKCRVDEAGVCHSQYPKSGSTLNHLILANFATPKLFGQRLHSILTIYSKYFL